MLLVAGGCGGAVKDALLGAAEERHKWPDANSERSPGKRHINKLNKKCLCLNKVFLVTSFLGLF